MAILKGIFTSTAEFMKKSMCVRCKPLDSKIKTDICDNCIALVADSINKNTCYPYVDGAFPAKKDSKDKKNK